MTESERQLGHRWFETVWNQGRREAITEMFTPGTVLHDGGVQSIGPAGFYPFFDRMRATFNDLRVTVHDSIAEGDKICIRWSCEAKHIGAGLGPVPTGVTVNVTGLTIIRVGNEMIQEAWQNWDMLGMLEQIQGVRSSATYIGAA